MRMRSPSADGRQPPGPAPSWNEVRHLQFWNVDGSVGGYVISCLHPGAGRSWYWASLVREGRPLVTVLEHEAPLPKPPGLELRSSGLWSELIVETPFEHMTVGLEAFGLAFDDPSVVYAKGWGDREPLGFDLEWETDGATPVHDASTWHEMPCRVHGEILVGRDRLDFDGWGHRGHAWGPQPWWTVPWNAVVGRFDDGAAFHLFVEAETGRSRGSAGATPVEGSISVRLDDRHLPVAAQVSADLGAGETSIDAAPRMWAPVHVDRLARPSRLGLVLCRFTGSDGRLGTGWVAVNRPVV